MKEVRGILHFIPIVRLRPWNSFLTRLIGKFGWILKLLANRFLSRIQVKGARIVGNSAMGNIWLRFNVDTPVANAREELLVPKDLVIFESIRSNGVWENNVCSFLAKAFDDESAAKEIPTILLDIGANSGMISIQVARLAKMPVLVYCVEPLPVNLEALELNLSKQKKLAGFKIFPYALGKQSGRTSVFSEKINLGNTSLQEMNEKSFFMTEIDIRATKQFIENEIPISANLVLKCDTQGYEVVILSDFSNAFWDRIVRGVIEVRGTYEVKDENLENILNNLSLYSTLYWGGDPKKKIEICEVRNFWLNGSGNERDLYFAR
jgi:FkbM family methyltransferase